MRKKERKKEGKKERKKERKKEKDQGGRRGGMRRQVTAMEGGDDCLRMHIDLSEKTRD